MNSRRRGGSITILIAEDDADDRLLLADAFHEARLRVDLRFVCDGDELLDYLWRREAYMDPETSPRPGLILLDLNMPRKDGREALAEIKGSTAFRHIPVVALTTSSANEDVMRTYALGGNSYIAKPVSFAALVDLVRSLVHYWFELVEPSVTMDDGEANAARGEAS